MIEDLRIYKPNLKGAGAASKIQLRPKEKAVKNREGKTITVKQFMVFWVAAQQTGKDSNGNASFAWDNDSKSVTIKLGDADLAEILAVLSGKKDYAGPAPKQAGGLPPGMFHKSPRGNSTFSISKNDNGDFRVRLSAQKQGVNGTIAIMHTLSVGEAEIVATLLRAAIVRKYGW